MITPALLLALLAGAGAQSQTRDDLAAIAPLVGKWVGTSEGQPGAGTVERLYEPALAGRFIRVRNRSIYPPQEKNPKGETHEDVGFFSYDRGRKTFILRQFHVEGFVNQFKGEISEDGKLIVFTSETIENIPAGYRARETYRILNENEFTETFEIAEPNKDFTVYSENHFKRH